MAATAALAPSPEPPSFPLRPSRLPRPDQIYGCPSSSNPAAPLAEIRHPHPPSPKSDSDQTRSPPPASPLSRSAVDPDPFPLPLPIRPPTAPTPPSRLNVTLPLSLTAAPLTLWSPPPSSTNSTSTPPLPIALARPPSLDIGLSGETRPDLHVRLLYAQPAIPGLTSTPLVKILSPTLAMTSSTSTLASDHPTSRASTNFQSTLTDHRPATVHPHLPEHINLRPAVAGPHLL